MFGGLLNSSRFQGLADLAGRLGNGFQPNGPQYSPQGGTGFSGIRRDVSMVNGAPVKNTSTAMSVTPESNIQRAGTVAGPTLAPPPVSIAMGGQVAGPSPMGIPGFAQLSTPRFPTYAGVAR